MINFEHKKNEEKIGASARPVLVSIRHNSRQFDGYVILYNHLRNIEYVQGVYKMEVLLHSNIIRTQSNYQYTHYQNGIQGAIFYISFFFNILFFQNKCNRCEFQSSFRSFGLNIVGYLEIHYRLHLFFWHCFRNLLVTFYLFLTI